MSSDTDCPPPQREALLEAMLANLVDLAYLFDREGRFLYVNRPVLELLGRSMEEVTEKTVAELGYPPELAERLQRQISKVVETGKPVVDETEFLSPSTGAKEFHEYHYNPVFGKDGKVCMVSGSTRVITGHKALEAALAESNRRHKKIMESIRDYAIFTLLPNGRVETWNKGAEALFGFEEAEIVGQEGEILWTLGDREAGIPAKEMELCREAGQAADERWHLRKDGTRFFALGTMHPILDANGNLTGFTKICHDVTQQRETAEELLTMRNRLDTALIAGEIGTWVFDVPNNRVYADKNLAALFGVSEEDANGGPIEAYYAAVHPEDLDKMQWSLRQALEHAEEFESSYRVISDVGERTLVARGRVERNKEGKVLRLPGVVLDVSAMKQAELELQTVQERLSLAVEAAELGTFYCPMPMEEIVWNNQCKAHFFLPPEATMDFKRFYELLHPEDRPFVREAVDQAVFGSGRYDVQYRVISPSGEQRWIHAIGRGFKDAYGKPSRFDGITMDVTLSRRMQEEREELLRAERAARTEAERTSRIKDEFLATLSHELRTPLNAILGWIQILRAERPSEEEISVGLETIERNARSQTQIIEDLLDMSRIISGKVRLDVQQVDLASVVATAIQTHRPAANAKGVALQAQLGAHVGTVGGDPGRLQQIFGNLLSNAVKFTPRGGSITVTIGRIGSQIEVVVTDTGEGIAPEFLPYVFDRFRQSDASTTRRHGGLGLGLAIVRQLVEIHSGTVEVHSSGPGKGARFRVNLPASLPLADAETLEIRSKASTGQTSFLSASRWDLSGLRVLAVDDEPDGRLLLVKLLGNCGAVVESAGSAAEGYELIVKNRFDLLISDIGMPEEDGYAFVQRVRQLGIEEGGGMPAIALTAYAREEDRQKAILNGFQMHLTKPVDAQELLTTIANLTSRGSKSA